MGDPIPEDFRPVRSPELAYVRAGERKPVALMFQASDGSRHVMELSERQALALAEDIIRLVGAALWQQGRGK